MLLRLTLTATLAAAAVVVAGDQPVFVGTTVGGKAVYRHPDGIHRFGPLPAVTAPAPRETTTETFTVAEYRLRTGAGDSFTLVFAPRPQDWRFGPRDAWVQHYTVVTIEGVPAKPADVPAWLARTKRVKAVCVYEQHSYTPLREVRLTADPAPND